MLLCLATAARAWVRRIGRKGARSGRMLGATVKQTVQQLQSRGDPNAGGVVLYVVYRGR